MSLPSYSDIFAISHDREHHEEIMVGDLVRTGENYHPHFSVVAVAGDKAWLRNLQSGADQLAMLSRCRRIDNPVALAVAA